jgi:imidazolonepropionase-like amidohydrolase
MRCIARDDSLPDHPCWRHPIGSTARVLAFLLAVFVVGANLAAAPAVDREDRRGPPPGPHGPPGERDGHGGPRAMRDFAAQPYASTYRPLPRRDTLIHGATVLDGAGRRHDAADVLMRDGQIVAVARSLDVPAGALRVDARGRWVTPGIVDPHSHLGNFPTPYTAEDAGHTDVNEDSDPNTAQVWSQHSVNVQDPGFAPRARRRRDHAAGHARLDQPVRRSHDRVAQRAGLHGAGHDLSGRALRPEDGLRRDVVHAYGDAGRFPVSRMGAVAGQRAAWLEARKYLHEWRRHADGEDRRPPEPDLKLDTLAGVLLGDIRVHAHCYRADDIAQLFDMAHEFDFRITSIHHAAEAYKVPGLFVREGACAAVWPDWWGFKREVYDAIRENAAYPSRRQAPASPCTRTLPSSASG